MSINIDLNDLTNAALKRLVTQLLSAGDKEERKILNSLDQKKAPKNDLADLDEEMHGKPNTPKVEEDDDPFDLEASGGDDSDSESLPPKKGKKK